MNDAFHTKFRQRELIMATFDIVRIECLSATRMDILVDRSFFVDNSFSRGISMAQSVWAECRGEGEKEKMYIGARYDFFLSIRY